MTDDAEIDIDPLERSVPRIEGISNVLRVISQLGDSSDEIRKADTLAEALLFLSEELLDVKQTVQTHVEALYAWSRAGAKTAAKP